MKIRRPLRSFLSLALVSWVATGVAAAQEELLKLRAPVPQAQAYFTSHWRALDGGLLVAGASENGGAGAAYLFEMPTGRLRSRLVASDAQPGAGFGSAAAIDGGVLLIGAPRHDLGSGLTEGAAYLFDAATGQELFRITASDPAFLAEFGRSVDVGGGRALVGARHLGAAYVFDVATGQELLKLPPAGSSTPFWFGCSVAIDGDRCAIGARGTGVFQAGAAYVYDLSTGVELLKLTDPIPSDDDGFGTSVSIRGDALAVSGNKGRAYVFDAWTGKERYRLTLPSIGGAGVSIDGERLIAGLIGDDDLGKNSGAARVFDLATGVELFELHASDGQAEDEFGSSVAIDGGLAAVGVPHKDGGPALPDSGAAYVYSIPPVQGVRFCFGDGGCPCGNDDVGAGCANSGGRGAILIGSGSASVSADDLLLLVAKLPPGRFTLTVMSSSTGSPAVFGDGLLCLTGKLFRLPVLQADAAGTVVLGGLVAYSTSHLPPDGHIGAGSSWAFQTWYRDPAGPCGTGFNASNGLEVTFVP